MKRLKTFLTYLILVVAFFALSKFLEAGFIRNMYKDMIGTVDGDFTYNGQAIYLDIVVNEAKSTNVNGYVDLTITNKANVDIEEAYLKVNLHSKSEVLAITKFMDIKDLKAGESRNYKLNFEGKYIKTYIVVATDEFPDKENIISIFGYEINTADIFGMDFSEYINAESISSFGKSIWHSFTTTVENIPWWGWFMAWLIIAGVW